MLKKRNVQTLFLLEAASTSITCLSSTSSVSSRSSRTSTRMSSILTSCPSLTALRISSHSLCLARPRPKCRYSSTEYASTHSSAGRWRIFWSFDCLCLLHLHKKVCCNSPVPTISSSSEQFGLCFILPVVPWAAALPGEQ